MLRAIRQAGVIAVLFILSACIRVDIPLLQPLGELHERTIEGEGKSKILLMDITGFISEKEHSGGMKEKPSMVAEVKEALQKAEKDEDIAGVILQINSPGGTVTASDLILHELLAFKAHRKMPMYACITGLGTSGGYYIATAADEISAHPTAITGSIGVIVMRFNVEGLMGKIGVSEKTVKSGEKKDLFSPFRPATPEEENIMQDIIDSLHKRFVEIVLARPGAPLTRPEVEKLADGRIYTADQAAAARLIDRIGYLDDTVAAMKKKLNLKEARVVAYFRPGSYRGTIYSGSSPESP
ncbi:MAG TPA: signal peptide peptidase SppA, partial [Geobacteraceae bacterium]|nr:signal peptide peptidase SppA [Geobacteraceae bacterium]